MRLFDPVVGDVYRQHVKPENVLAMKRFRGPEWDKVIVKKFAPLAIGSSNKCVTFFSMNGQRGFMSWFWFVEHYEPIED